MLVYSRRNFLKAGSAVLLQSAAFLNCKELEAQSLGLPLGLQLSSVRYLLAKDFEGTLQQVSAMGYREVEIDSTLFYNHDATQLKQAMQGANLNCVSAHYSSDELLQRLDEILAFGKELGLSYIVCSFPGFENASESENRNYRKQGRALTLEDWRWNAEQLNRSGDKVSAAGMKFGYHNHWMEFQEQGGVVPFAELIRLTDPSKVTIEMDCGLVVVGGGNPIEYLRRYRTRISMLHIKDYKMNAKPGLPSNRASTSMPRPPAAELGQGSIDYRPILQEAAKAGHIKHCFVEQEEFDMPTMQGIKIDAEYMRKMNA